MNQSFRTALKEGDEPAWVSRQKKVFTSWINLRIKGRDIAPVEDIFEDLKSGFVLYHLFEVLSGTSLRPLGKMNKNAKLRVQRVDNMNIVWAYIKQIDLPLKNHGHFRLDRITDTAYGYGNVPKFERTQVWLTAT